MTEVVEASKAPDMQGPQVSEKRTESSLNEAANVRYLEPEDFTLIRTQSGALKMTLKDDKSILRVKARRCFPFALPSKYVSIRSGSDEEIGIISDLSKLDKQYRRWIEDELDSCYFTPLVKSIKRITYRYGGVEWLLETDRGSKKIVTRNVHDSITEVEPSRYILTDADGNRYELHYPKLDAQSLALLDRLI